ncbi:MAG: flagellar motor switch protein FliG [Rhizobiaceae bacterium]|nr:flagellar motor switch protein FliG [Rhizobiaceae bacterium]MCV0409186.1 flagellar motor switch protein FliG [Rhizobiaceae bacterium]
MADTALTLTQPQKAAAILVAMGKPAAGRLLKHFKQEELKFLIEGARQLRRIPQSDLERIVEEFEAEFAEGVGLLDSADEMDTILNESLTTEEIDAIMTPRDTTAPVVQEVPVWPQIEKLEPARVAEFLEAENVQIAAYVLSRLDNSAAAAILVALPKPARTETVKRMLALGTVSEAAEKLIERQLRGRLLAESSGKDNTAGQTKVASLLNELDKGELDELLGDLEKSGTADLDKVRSRLFAFEDIVQLDQRSRVALFDGVATDMVTLALRGAPADLTEAVLSAIGARSRRMIESELAAGDDGVAQDGIVRARKTIASTAIRLANQGALELPSSQSQSAAA